MKKIKSHWFAPGVKSIEDEAAEIWKIQKSLLFEKNRIREVVEARQVLMDYYDNKLKKEEKRNSEVIATAKFNKDRTTIYHTRKTIANLLATDKTFTDKYNRFYQNVN